MTSLHDGHPDEGTIHAWLDRQLDATSSATLEAHLQRCDECAERVAEARGLIAGTSRILGALDEDTGALSPILRAAPAAAPTLPPVPPPARGRWRSLRVTPARAAIAATIVVALGLTVTRERTGLDVPPPSPVASPQRTDATAQLRAPAVPPRDDLLDSAVARNLARAQPPRAIEPSPDMRIATRPSASGVVPATASMARIDSSSATRVAAGRGALRAQRDSTVGSDLGRMAQLPTPSRSASTDQAIAAAQVADKAARDLAGRAASSRAGFSAAPAIAGGVVKGVEATQCLRVESATGTAATWGSVALPLVIALDAPATSSLARVLTTEGVETDTRALWQRAPNDSLLFTLRRIGFSGSLALGEPGPVRAGVMRSSLNVNALESVVVTSADSPAPVPRAALRRRALKEAPVPDAATSAPAVPVVARTISCPARDVIR